MTKNNNINQEPDQIDMMNESELRAELLRQIKAMEAKDSEIKKEKLKHKLFDYGDLEERLSSALEIVERRGKTIAEQAKDIERLREVMKKIKDDLVARAEINHDFACLQIIYGKELTK